MISDTAILVALILGLTEIIKRVGCPVKFVPIIAVILGVILNFLGKWIGVASSELAIGGIMAGLMAMGLWSGSKAISGK